jgi:16S rRNA (guanine966-N2)-methyltransferase
MPAPGAGRVIAGSARGIRLVGAGAGVRPMGDRLKEALFAILEPRLRGGAVLDLFAGTGAAGIEALSRGAAAVTFVESARPAIAAIERNLAAAHLAGPAARVVQADAGRWLLTATGPFDVVIADPPYDESSLLEAVLERVAGTAPPTGATLAAGHTILAPTGILVAKHGSRTRLPERIGLLASERIRRFGESSLTFYAWSEAEEA